ncbi:hypothetical protein SOVF_066150 [Spinacia oleracea]|uniref:Uncharacterized protein n=1 Tax=Spinacia oleracea TaxID=3562 RepID=A0A9R0K2B1_SPIOL|nr:uncharacterized protein LOC110795161 [Spinacia oleracea]KNA18941.1 hypothetical protein SOVF_066150 [Spinacia oleracea]
MGKSLPSTAGLKNFARIISSERITPPKQFKPTSSNNKSSVSIAQSATTQPRVDSAQLGLRMDITSTEGRVRVPLSEVVMDCARRWFQDTLKEAKKGDTTMQVLVGQMYNSGYGVHKDTEKGRGWISVASKGRASAWKVSNKPPGYNVSDSESQDLEDSRS